MIDPGIISGIGGLVGGLFGGGQTDQMEQLLRMMELYAKRTGKIGKWYESYAGGVPGSDPQEQAQLNQLLAVLGSQQRAGRENLYAAGYTPENAGNTGDLLNNFNLASSAQAAAAQGGLQQNWLANRQNARLTAAQLYGQAGGLAGQAFGAAGAMPGNDIGALIAQLAQQYGYSQQQRRYQPPRATPGVTTPGMSSPYPAQAAYPPGPYEVGSY